jgi:hypothetical protein
MPVLYDQRTLPLERGAIPAASGVTLAWDFTGMGSLPEAEPFIFGGGAAPSLTVNGTRTAVTYNGIPGIRPNTSPSSYFSTSFLGQGLQVGTGDFQLAVLITTGPTLPTTSNTVNALVIRSDAGVALVSFIVSESPGTGWFLNANASTGEGPSVTATMYGVNKTVVLWFRRRGGVTNIWTQEASPSGILVDRYSAGSDSTDWSDTTAKRLYMAWNQSSSAFVDIAIHGVRFWGGSSLDDATTQNVGRDFFALEANSVPADTLTITSPAASSSIPTTTTISGTYTGNAPSGVQVQHGAGAWVTASGFTAVAGVWSANVVLPVAAAAALRARYSNNTSVVSADVAGITVEANSIAFDTPAASSDSVVMRARDYRLFQRDGSNQAAGVRLIGTYDGAPTAIQWRYNGGGWATLDAAPSGGAFDATVTLPGPAQGPLEVRFANDTAVSAALSYVGVGDIFIAAGQSNALGWSTSYLQPVPPPEHAGWKAVVFDMGHTWRENMETPSAPFSGVDAPVYSAFFTRASGSYYGHLATLAMAAGVPIAVVPAARGSSSIDMWSASNPGNTTTLYGALQATAQKVGTSRAVLWWQGEGSMADDATGTGLDPTLYADKLDAIMDVFAAAGQTAKWVLTLPCLAHPTPTTNGVTFRAALAGMAGNEHVSGVLDLDNPTPAYTELHYDGSGQMIDIAERMATLLGYMEPPVVVVEPVAPTSGAIVLIGASPTLAQPRTVSPTDGVFVVEGNAPTYTAGGAPPVDATTYEKTVGETIELTLNWAGFLGGEPAASTAWSAPGLTIVSQTTSAGIAKIRVSGGGADTTYTLVCTVSTGTRTASAQITLRVFPDVSATSFFSDLVYQARGVLGDRTTPYRYSDEDLLGYANDALLILANVRPQLFVSVLSYTCVAGAVQQLPTTTTIGLVSILGLRPTVRDLLDRLDPDWIYAESAAARHWAPCENDPHRFYVVPPASAGQVLQVSFAAAPGRYNLTDTFPVLKTFWPAVIDYVVGMAESRDDEHVVTQRAQQFLAKTASLMGGSNG